MFERERFNLNVMAVFDHDSRLGKEYMLWELVNVMLSVFKMIMVHNLSNTKNSAIRKKRDHLITLKVTMAGK